MAGNKRRRETVSNGTDKPKNDNSSQQNGTTSSLSAMESSGDFPRGGGSTLTPLEYKEAVTEAKREALMGTDGAEVTKTSTKPTKKKKKVAAKATPSNEEDLSSVPVESLKYKNIVPGTLLLGQISQINTLDIAVSLPNNLTGYVPITNISDKLSHRLENLDDAAAGTENEVVDQIDEFNNFPDLIDLYHVGQWVRACVTKVGMEESKNNKKHIELSMRPQDANGSTEDANNFTRGSVIQAAVSSVEDHGIVFDVGLKNFTGFLSKNKVGEFTFAEGQSLICTVLSKDQRIFHLSLSTPASAPLDVLPSVQAILPGNYINVLITDLKDNGVVGKYMGVVDVTSDLYHCSANQTKDLEKQFKLAKSSPARVLFVIPGDPPKIAISFLPHVLNFNFDSAKPQKLDQLDVGFIIDSAKVTYVSPSLGVFCDVGVPGIYGFTHISRLSDKKVANVNSNNGPYKLNSVHRARVIGYSYVDNLFILSFQNSVLEQPFLRIEDIQVGQHVEGTVSKLIPQGIVVSVADGINALVPSSHMSDIALQFPERRFKVGATVKGRVLTTNVLRRRVIVTLKKSLLNSELPPICTYEEATPGTRAIGVLARVLEDGAVVEFYNSVRGFLPVSEMSEAYIRDAREHFKIGQTVSVTILSCEPSERKMRVSCREQNWDEKRLEQFNNIPLGSVVSGSVLQKTENSVIVDLGNKVSGVIALGHLSDGDLTKCTKVLNKLRVSTKLTDVLVLRKGQDKKNISLSLKRSLIEAAKEERFPKAIEEIKEGIKYAGFVRNTTDFGVFVEFCDGLVALVPKAYLSEDYVPVPGALFKSLQSVECVCLSVNLQQKKIFMSFKPLSSNKQRVTEVLDSKYDIEKPVDESIKKTYNYTTGKITWGIITSVKASQLNVELAANLQGRVEVSEVFDRLEDIENLNKPLKNFKKGDKIRVRVLGIHDSKHHKFLPISHRVAPKQFLELSMRPSVMSMEPFKLETPSFKKGDSVVAYVNNTSQECVWVSITTTINGRIMAMDLDNDAEVINAIPKYFFGGKALKCTVIDTSKILSLSLIKPVDGYESVNVGDKFVGRVTNVNDSGAIVHLPGHLSGRVSRLDMSDDYDIAPSEKFVRNKYISVYVLDVDVPNKKIALSARESRVKPQTAEVKDREVESIEDLKPGDICRGFVSNVADQGLFVSLSRNLVARVKIAELFDTFIKEWKTQFQVNKLVRGKILSVDYDTKRIEMTLKPSKIDESSSITTAFSDIQVGSNVDGTVAKVEDYGVLIQIDSTDGILGLCHKSEIADAVVNDISRLYSVGDKVRAHVLDVNPEKRRISLGLKSSYFDADSDVELSDEIEMQSADESSEDEMEEDQQSEAESDKSSSSEDENDNDETAALNVNGFDWDDNSTVFDKPAHEISESESEDDETPKRKKSKSDHFNDEERNLDEAPRLPVDFERQLLSSPNSSFLWISYMAYQLNLNEIEKAREIGQRALTTINYREEEEKLNVWMALLNLEIAYGTTDSLQKTFKDACAHCEPLVIYEKLCGVLIKSNKMDLANEYMEGMLKNFKQVPGVWIQYASFLLTNGNEDKARGLLQRSLQSLPKSEHVKIIEKFAILEFKQGDPERGRTVFEGLLSNYPKRLDLWNVLIDMEIKQGDTAIVRRLFERVLASKLSTKKAKFIFKKWLTYEKEIGDNKGVEAVKQKALEYVSGNRED
ncbi:U3 snoRNP-associated protein Rrp5 [Schizosaccharomyces cryophilus OY26]|uniref:rRNA biogenesis protein RRP5 n=1 Tax=Schizosaccharomyces cryophilus (strain OY26 / ATCC MYA-4695 / CBS 11777 / NBRC 106824 / NRRL Y48691) TaxID=653667 RepID=S9WYY0_SCHCR|nr:U3 snoRNP-associated protein Rrp5 [Schizosaccharomyces cryophilus OY26]EPY49902.1 U3 snoRNP-associated protein Rrp5 [Schizosaccharomyces cryophilus OY26]